MSVLSRPDTRPGFWPVAAALALLAACSWWIGCIAEPTHEPDRSPWPTAIPPPTPGTVPHGR